MGIHSDNARERIIDAAEQVVIEAGARHLTLAAVASKAGVSRGGLLYHFPYKEDLLRGMMDRRRTHMMERRKTRMALTPQGPEREAVAYVLSLLGDHTDANTNISAAIIAAGAHDPKLLAPVKKNNLQTITDLTRDGLSFERAAVILLAANGLRFFEVLSMSSFSAKERGKIIDELLALAKENKGHKG